MALTKVQTIGIETGISLAGVTTVVTLNASGNVTAVDGTFTGNVSVAGTLTYEDVTNVDSVGLITARNGVSVTGGDFKVGSATTISQDNIFTTGIVTATTYYGDGSNLTGISVDSTQIVTGNTSVQTVDTGSDGHIKFNTEGTERARFDSSGRFGLGTTSVNEKLHISGTGDIKTEIATTSTGSGADVGLEFTTGDGYNWIIQTGNVVSGGIRVYDIQNNSERLRVDSSGRLLVGTNSIFDTNQSGTNPSVGVEKANGYATLALKSNQASGNGSYLILGKSRGTSANSKTLVNNGDELGGIYFEGADGSAMRTLAGISATVDGATGASDIPTRLMFYTTADGSSASTERMRITNGGFVGINQTNPGVLLDLNPGTNTRALRVQSGNSFRIGLESGDGVASGGLIGSVAWEFNGTNYASVRGYKNAGSAFTDLAFNSGLDTEKLRLTGNGHLYVHNEVQYSSSYTNMIYTGSDNVTLGVRFNTNVSGKQYGIEVNNIAGVANSYAMIFGNGSTTVGSILMQTSSTQFNTTSDYRLKENIVPLTGAIERVNQLQVRRFNFIIEPDNTVDGFIAHEVKNIVPEAVSGEKDGVKEDGSIDPQGIDQSKLVPLLTAALQEAIAKIETLEARLTALEGS